MSKKKVLTLEDFKEFLESYKRDSSESYSIDSATMDKFFEYVKNGYEASTKQAGRKG